MPWLSDIFGDYLLPALIVAAGMVLGWGAWRGGKGGRAIGALAVAMGFAAALCAIGGVPRWPPGRGDAAFRLVWGMLPIAVLAVGDAVGRPPMWVRVAILFIVAQVGLRWLAAPLMANAAAGEQWALATGVDAFSAVLVLWWVGLEAQAERLTGGAVPLILAIVAAGAAGVLGISANVKAAQAATALTGMMFVTALLAWPLRQLSLARGAVLVFVVSIVGLMAFVHFYSYTEPPRASDALIVVAPLLAWSGEMRWVRKRPRWRALVRVGPVVMMAALAVAWTVHQVRAAHPADPTAAGQMDY